MAWKSRKRSLTQPLPPFSLSTLRPRPASPDKVTEFHTLQLMPAGGKKAGGSGTQCRSSSQVDDDAVVHPEPSFFPPPSPATLPPKLFPHARASPRLPASLNQASLEGGEGETAASSSSLRTSVSSPSPPPSSSLVTPSSFRQTRRLPRRVWQEKGGRGGGREKRGRCLPSSSLLSLPSYASQLPPPPPPPLLLRSHSAAGDRKLEEGGREGEGGAKRRMIPSSSPSSPAGEEGTGLSSTQSGANWRRKEREKEREKKEESCPWGGEEGGGKAAPLVAKKLREQSTLHGEGRESGERNGRRVWEFSFRYFSLSLSLSSMGRGLLDVYCSIAFGRPGARMSPMLFCDLFQLLFLPLKWSRVRVSPKSRKE